MNQREPPIASSSPLSVDPNDSWEDLARIHACLAELADASSIGIQAISNAIQSTDSLNTICNASELIDPEQLRAWLCAPLELATKNQSGGDLAQAIDRLGQFLAKKFVTLQDLYSCLRFYKIERVSHTSTSDPSGAMELLQHFEFLDLIFQRIGNAFSSPIQNPSSQLPNLTKGRNDSLSGLPDIHLLIDIASQKIVDCNDALLAATGISRDTAYTSKFTSIFTEACQRSASDSFQRLLATKSTQNLRLQLSSSDEHSLDVWASLSLIASRIGEVKLCRLQLRDISGLVAAESLFAAVFEHSLIAKIVVDQQGIITLSNRAAEELFRSEPGQLIGLCVEQLVPKPNRGEHPKLRQGFRGGSTAQTMGAGRDLSACTLDGEEFPVEVLLSPLPRGAGEGRVLASVYNLKQRKAFEVELKRSNAALQEFAFIASHDLQSPLRSVRSYAELIETKYGKNLPDDGQRYIQKIVVAARRMQSLIDNLLSYSRAGSRTGAKEPVDLNEVMEQVKEILESDIEATQAQIHYPRLPVVRGDHKQLLSLFQNLTSNAIKFRSDAPPKIKIEVTASTHWVEIAYGDNGIGIAKKDHASVFEMFQRVQKQANPEGTGIGLALVKRVVESHGGEIQLDSEENRGTTFHFSLPRHNPSAGHTDR